MIFKRIKYQLLMCLCIGNSWMFGQASYDYTQLKLSDAIEIGLQNNKKLKVQNFKTNLSVLNELDLKNEKLPEIDFHTGFHVLTNLRQYDNGFLHPSTKHETPRIKYDFSLSAEIPVYLGGKLKLDEEKAAIETEIQKLKFKREEREVRMQIITSYLQVLHLQEQQKLITDKMREDSAIIDQTIKLEKNGVVTHNEVLRTKLQLSNHQMSFSELENEIAILEHRIKTILSVPEVQDFHIDTSDLFTSTDKMGVVDQLVLDAMDNSESLSITKKDVELKVLDKKLTKSNVLPKITAGAEYTFSYPNMIFFPPVEHLYRVGLVGVNITMPITNFYKNKVKMQMAEKNISMARLQVEEKEEQLRHDVFSAHKKLEEAVDKIKIAEQAIEQAKENYRIVKLKYINKLSLITELIDADNAYLAAQSNLISLQINKQLKYYQLQYVIGNL